MFRRERERGLGLAYKNLIYKYLHNSGRPEPISTSAFESEFDGRSDEPGTKALESMSDL